MSTMARKTTKERHLSVRVSRPDMAALERAAAAARLSVATYVRQQALKAAERDDPVARQRRVADLVKRMGSLPRHERGDE